MIEKEGKEIKDEKKHQDIVSDIESDDAVSEICATKEIEIEEMAIDGICGVY